MEEASYREGVDSSKVRHEARVIPEAAWLLSVFLCFLCTHVASCTSGSWAHVFADMCVHVH